VMRANPAANQPKRGGPHANVADMAETAAMGA
jgi:hypothetical protein